MAGTVRAPGDEVGGYTIIRSLGAGGSGHVYLVQDASGAHAALKLVDARADAVAAERLRREVRALQSLRSDAIPRVLDAELDDDETFVVFEFIPGESLVQHVDEHGPLRGEELADFAERIADALTTAHRAGVVHRDVTPSNVMLSPRGAVLIDFGLSHRAEDARLTRDGLVSGTAGYVAPEVIDGAEPGPIADCWSWAATVAFAMTGEAPFGVGSAAIRKTLAGKPVLADVPGADAVRAALGKDISRRPPMREVVAALRGATQVVGGVGATKVLPVDLLTDEDLDLLDDEPVAPTHVLPARSRVVAGAGDGDGAWSDDDAGGAWSDDGWGAAAGDGEEWDDDSDEWDEDDGYDEEAEPRPHRPAMLLAWTLTASIAAAVAPVLALGALVLAAWVGRATYRRHLALLAARAKHGARRRDAVIHTMGLPWHMARALVELLPSVFAASVIGVGVGALGWWLVGAHLFPDGSEHTVLLGRSAALFLGALAAAASLWWGLWSEGTRDGAHRFAAGVAPTRGVTALWVLVAVVASASLALAVWLGVEPWWWPLPPMPR